MAAFSSSNPRKTPLKNIKLAIEDTLKMIKIEKNIYEPKEATDGTRILIMRIWPRGISKSHVDEWLKDLGSSRPLIKDWKNCRISWPEFRKRYLES